MRILLSDLCLQTGTAPKQLVCAFVWVCANTAWPDCGIEVRSNKTHPASEKRGSQKNTGQVGLHGIVRSQCGLLSPDFFSVDLKVTAH